MVVIDREINFYNKFIITVKPFLFLLVTKLSLNLRIDVINYHYNESNVFISRF